MTSQAVPRKRTTVTIDVDAIAAFQRLAKKANTSLSRYLESVMVVEAQNKGELPEDYELLGETRGHYKKVQASDRTTTNNEGAA